MRKPQKDLFRITIYILVFLFSAGVCYSCSQGYFEPNATQRERYIGEGFMALTLIFSLVAALRVKNEYIKICDSHFEVMFGKKVVWQAPYSDIAFIAMTRFLKEDYSGSFDFRGRDSALISIHSHESNYLQEINMYSAMRRKTRDHDYVYAFFPFSSEELLVILGKTSCNLYITEEMFKAYRNNLYSVIKTYGERIYICCKNAYADKENRLISLSDYVKYC